MNIDKVYRCLLDLIFWRRSKTLVMSPKLTLRQPAVMSPKKVGGQRVNFTAFYEALLNAKGVDLGTGSAGIGKGSRKLSYTAKVQGNGNLLVGKAYTAMLDLNTGDEFEIKLGRKAIRLIPVGSTDEEGEE